MTVLSGFSGFLSTIKIMFMGFFFDNEVTGFYVWKDHSEKRFYWFVFGPQHGNQMGREFRKSSQEEPGGRK